MIKILSIIFIFIFSYIGVYASGSLNIISRGQWGANEEYRYIDSEEWKDIIKKRQEPRPTLSEEQLKKARENAALYKNADQFLVSNYKNKLSTQDEIIYKQNGRALAWPITKSKKIYSIVIHHTDMEYDSSYDAMKKIFH